MLQQAGLVYHLQFNDGLPISPFSGRKVHTVSNLQVSSRIEEVDYVEFGVGCTDFGRSSVESFCFDLILIKVILAKV